MDATFDVTRADLLVLDDRIAAFGDAVGPALARLPGGRPDRTLDATGCLVLPGFVHGHMHLCQTLFRGLAEQSDLLRWLRERIWPLEAAHTAASMAASVRLAATELIAGGVTCLNDMGTVHHTDVLAETVLATGLRAFVGKALMDQGHGVPAGLRETAHVGHLGLDLDRLATHRSERVDVDVGEPRDVLGGEDAIDASDVLGHRRAGYPSVRGSAAAHGREDRDLVARAHLGLHAADRFLPVDPDPRDREDRGEVGPGARDEFLEDPTEWGGGHLDLRGSGRLTGRGEEPDPGGAGQADTSARPSLITTSPSAVRVS